MRGGRARWKIENETALDQRCGRGPHASAKPAALSQVSAKFSRRIQSLAAPWNPLTFNNR